MSTFKKIENISLYFHFGFGLATNFCLHLLNVLTGHLMQDPSWDAHN
jgi:hypothetical protein